MHAGKSCNCTPGRGACLITSSLGFFKLSFVLTNPPLPLAVLLQDPPLHEFLPHEGPALEQLINTLVEQSAAYKGQRESPHPLACLPSSVS